MTRPIQEIEADLRSAEAAVREVYQRLGEADAWQRLGEADAWQRLGEAAAAVATRAAWAARARAAERRVDAIRAELAAAKEAQR